MPRLHELVAKTGWATNLAILAEGKALVVEEVYGATTRTMPRMVGGRLPLHATAIGKALLSGFSEAELARFLGGGLLRPFTPQTVVRPNLLRDQIERIRTSGVAFSHEEWTVGTSGVAGPIYRCGRLIGAVAVVGEPKDSHMRQHAHHVRVAASRISQALDPVRELTAA